MDSKNCTYCETCSEFVLLGQWTDCTNTVDVNDQCNKFLNSKRFMLDMLYAQKKKAEEDEKENENEKECSGQDSSVTSLACRISTLEARQQTCDDNMKKLEVEHLDKQGSVRAVAEKFGDLMKGLVSPHEVELSGKESSKHKKNLCRLLHQHPLKRSQTTYGTS